MTPAGKENLLFLALAQTQGPGALGVEHHFLRQQTLLGLFGTGRSPFNILTGSFCHNEVIIH